MKKNIFLVAVIVSLFSWLKVSASTSSGGSVEFIPAARNLGIGIMSPHTKLTVNGNLAIKEGSAPSASSSYGKLYANSSNSKLYFLDDSGNSYNLLNGSTASLTDATTLDTLDSTQFLRADASTTYSSGTITFDAGTGVDINSTNVSIADTNISFDGASTTFTGTGAMTLSPGAGTNLNVSLSGAGDFAVNTNQLYVDTSAARVGINKPNPSYTLDVNGTAFSKVQNFNGNSMSIPSLSQGSLLVAAASGTLRELAKGTDHYVLKVNGNKLAWESDLTGAGGGSPAGSSTHFQFNDGGSFGGNGALSFNKTTRTLSVASNASLDINSSSVSIADTDITLDGASTTFTQSSGGITLSPASNSDLEVSLSGTGALKVGINKLVVGVGGSSNVGLSMASPRATLDLNGTLAVKPSALTNITAGSGITVSKAVMKIQGNGGAVDISSNPQIADGVDGQLVILKGASNTNTVLLEHGTGLALIDGLSFTMGDKDMITLIYDGTDDEWVEISRSDAI